MRARQLSVSLGCVFIDFVKMGKMTGDKLVHAILEIRPHTPIIPCTGYSENIWKEGGAPSKKRARKFL